MLSLLGLCIGGRWWLLFRVYPTLSMHRLMNGCWVRVSKAEQGVSNRSQRCLPGATSGGSRQGGSERKSSQTLNSQSSWTRGPSRLMFALAGIGLNGPHLGWFRVFLMNDMIWWKATVHSSNLVIHSMNEPLMTAFDEKPLQWKAASMKSCFDEKPPYLVMLCIMLNGSGFSPKRLFTEAAFHQTSFSPKRRLFIFGTVHRM